MAKVMISIPDQLLARIDAHAQRVRETRSGFLQRIAEKELDVASSQLRDEVERLLDQIEPLDPGSDVARLVREDRDSH